MIKNEEKGKSQFCNTEKHEGGTVAKITVQSCYIMVYNTTIWTVQVFWGHPAVWRLIVKHKENITDNADNNTPYLSNINETNNQ